MDINALCHLADFHKILLYYDFSSITDCSDKIRACCKLHGGNKSTSFEVDIDKGLWYCHSGCKTGGNAITLVQQLESCTFMEACYKVAEISNITITDGIDFKQRDMEDARKLREWFDGLKPRTISLPTYRQSTSYPSQSILEYRGLNASTLSGVSFYDIYPIDTEKRLYNRIAFPLIIGGRQVGVSLRSTKKGDLYKWIHLPKGFKRSNFLYNYDECLSYLSEHSLTEVIVVEGILDCLKYKQAGIGNVVAVLGSSISEGQVTLLMKIATSLVLSFDGDDAGLDATKRTYNKLKKRFDLFFLPIPYGSDPNMLAEEELNHLYQNKIKM